MTDEEFFALPAPTPQQAFTRVWQKLTEQGEAATMDGNPYRCRYRGADGNKCAVGHLISDADYREEMDEIGPINFLSDKGLVPKNLHHLDITFLENLQWAHDHILRIKGLKQWQSRMREIARKWNLEAPSC